MFIMFTKSTFIVALIFFMLVVGSVSSWARGAYKWVDEEGTVHYSDRLQGNNAEIINVRVPEIDEQFDEEPLSTAGSQKDSARKKTGESQSQPSQREQKKRRKENCNIASETLKKNQSMGRMYRVGADSEWIYLTDPERAEVLKKSRDAVKEWCG